MSRTRSWLLASTASEEKGRREGPEGRRRQKRAAGIRTYTRSWLATHLLLRKIEETRELAHADVELLSQEGILVFWSRNIKCADREAGQDSGCGLSGDLSSKLAPEPEGFQAIVILHGQEKLKK